MILYYSQLASKVEILAATTHIRQKIRSHQNDEYFSKQRQKQQQKQNLSSLQNSIAQMIINNQSTDELVIKFKRMLNYQFSYENVKKLLGLGLMDSINELIVKGQFVIISFEAICLLLSRFGNLASSIDLKIHANLQYSLKKVEVAPHSAYIIAKLCLNSQNHLHQFIKQNIQLVLISQFKYRAKFSKNIELDSQGQGQKLYNYILYALQAIVSGKNKYFTTYKYQVAIFIADLLEKRVFVNQSLAILCQIGINQGHIYIPPNQLITNLLNQASPQSNYLYNLFALINILSPLLQIDWKLMIQLSNNNPLRYLLLRIMEKIAKVRNSFLDQIPSGLWWNDFITHLDSYNTCSALALLASLNIECEWFFRLLNDYLGDFRVPIRNQAINILTKTLITKYHNQQLKQMNRLLSFIDLKKLIGLHTNPQLERILQFTNDELYTI